MTQSGRHLLESISHLGNNGSLTGESETARITGTTGGQVLFTTTLNAPTSINPGNLGAIISSSQNLGTVIIKRGHQSQTNGGGNGSSIFRYYDITPANNSGLNATLRFQYFDTELNSLNENSLILWRSTNNVHWAPQGFTTRNTSTNYVEKTTIDAFSRWTLTPVGNPLPVQFISFVAACNGDKAILNWTTTEEVNVSHFNIEKSTDGINWFVAGTINPGNIGNNVNNYSFTDISTLPGNLYRIAEQDFNGRKQYSKVVRMYCGTNDFFNLWPNPAIKDVWLQINVANSSTAVIKLFNAKGALVKMQTFNLVAGANQLKIDISNLSNGLYLFVTEWNNGANQKTTRVIKN